MKSINKKSIQHERKIEHYKEKKQENDIDLKIKMLKWMKIASFYRPKRTIHVVINYWISGQLRLSGHGGLGMDFVLDEMTFLQSEFSKVVFMKVVGICLNFPPKEVRAHLDF